MRQDRIRDAIANLSGERFESFSIELLRRTIYPGPVPTAPGSDLGEDAYTTSSTLHLHDGKHISVAASKTSTWKKLRDDCLRCHNTKRKIDRFVFVTIGPVQQKTIGKWKEKVKVEFGWELEIFAIDWLAQEGGRPEHEAFVDEHLRIPPPAGDYVTKILGTFKIGLLTRGRALKGG